MRLQVTVWWSKSTYSPVCGKHILSLKDTLKDDDEFTTEASFSFDFGSEIQTPDLTGSFDYFIPNQGSKSRLQIFRGWSRIKASKRMKQPLAGSDKDIAAFKRVVWQDSDE